MSGLTCSVCIRFSASGGRGRCLNDKSKHYRMPREAQGGCCDRLMRVEPEPEPPPKPTRPPVVRRPKDEPKFNRRAKEQRLAELYMRNLAKKGAA